MEYAQLGSTGVFVSRVALGAMTFGGAGTPLWDRVGALDIKAADELVGMSLDRGINLIDTADAYAGGESEEILGKVLAPVAMTCCSRPRCASAWDLDPTRSD